MSILRWLLIQIPILNVDSSSDDADELLDVDEQHPMEIDDDDDDDNTKPRSIHVNTVRDILKIFDSKQLTDKIEASLVELSNDEAALKDVCLSVSHICNFVLLNSRVKIHKTL